MPFEAVCRGPLLPCGMPNLIKPVELNYVSNDGLE